VIRVGFKIVHVRRRLEGSVQGLGLALLIGLQLRLWSELVVGLVPVIGVPFMSASLDGTTAMSYFF